MSRFKEAFGQLGNYVARGGIHIDGFGKTPHYQYVFRKDEVETIQLALRIADRLESGKISHDVKKVGMKRWDKAMEQAKADAAEVSWFDMMELLYEAMSAQLIKECEETKGGA